MSTQVPENPVKKNRDDFSPLVVIAALMVTSYLTANIMAVKLVGFFDTAIIDAGTITFPLAYLLGDILTEIWGFKTARKVIFLTFACNILLVAATAIGVLLPSPDYLQHTAEAYGTIFTYVPRIVFASLIAFLVGELTNAYLMERIKTLTKGRYLWVRTIGSSAVGYLFDTAIFCFIAFAGIVKISDIMIMIGVQYAVKLAIETVCGTPLAYAGVGLLRKKFGY